MCLVYNVERALKLGVPLLDWLLARLLYFLQWRISTEPNSRNVTPPPLKPDSASQANFQALSTQLGDSCSAPILEPERSALLQEALVDSQLQAVKAQLERRGFAMNADEAQAVRLVGGEQLVIPFGQDAHLVWTRTNGQTAAVGLIRQGNKTLNVVADGQERMVKFLNAQQAEKLLRKLREKSKFQEFEGKLAQKGKRVGRVRVLFDETNKIAILGIALEGNEEKIGHQVRIRVKANKEDEPEDDAEPAIQATACGQASGEAVPTGAKMQPLALPREGGGFEGGYEGPQICTSQWGYDYLCLSRTPILSFSTTSLALPQTFINQQVQASFVIWNYGGGRLTGTVSVPAPFSIVSGGSFSLLPGQPQEVVVRFSSATAGSFSRSLSISSNGGNATVTATAVAHKVSFSPATLDFGSGLLVMREQCNQMGMCGLRTEKVGLPIEKQLTVKNEGSVSVTLTLSTSAPYKIVSVLPTLSPGQSAQVTLRFDPTESGTFTGSVQVGINGGQGSVTAPLVGVAHKIEISPAVLDFGLVFVGTSREQKLTVKNEGVTTVTVETLNTIMINVPFQITLPENPITLGPGKSMEAIVRFSPSTSGVYAANVSLAINSLTKEVAMAGVALTLEEYMERLRTAGYPILYTEHSTLNLGLLFAGIGDLSLERIGWFKQMYGSQPEGPNEDPRRWNQIVQALQLLQTIDPNELSGWLSSLQRALVERGEAGFREEYDRLFASYADFPKYVAIVLALRGKISPEIQLDNIIDFRDFITGLLIEMILEILRGLVEPPESERPRRAIDVWTWTLMWNLREDFKQKVGWDAAAQELWQEFEEAWADLVLLLPGGAVALSHAIYVIGYRILQTVAPWSFGCVYSNCNRYEAMKTFAAFLQWALQPTSGGMSGIDRLEQGVGTLYALSMLAIAGWHMHGFVVEGPWAAGLAFLPRGSIAGYDKGIVLVLRGDHCTDCAAKASQIIDWVKKAIDHIQCCRIWPGIPTGFQGGYSGDVQPIITLVFTNSNAIGIPTVISALQREFGSRTDVVIVVMYFERQPNGALGVNLTCIGAQCEELERAGVLEKIRSDYSRALRLATLAYPGLPPHLAWHLAYGVCGGDPDCIKFIADSLEEELKEKCGGDINNCSEFTP